MDDLEGLGGSGNTHDRRGDRAARKGAREGRGRRAPGAVCDDDRAAAVAIGTGRDARIGIVSPVISGHFWGRPESFAGRQACPPGRGKNRCVMSIRGLFDLIKSNAARAMGSRQFRRGSIEHMERGVSGPELLNDTFSPSCCLLQLFSALQTIYFSAVSQNAHAEDRTHHQCCIHWWLRATQDRSSPSA